MNWIESRWFINNNKIFELGWDQLHLETPGQNLRQEIRIQDAAYKLNLRGLRGWYIVSLHLPKNK